MARSEDRDRRKRLRKMMQKLQEIDPYEILPYLTCLSQMRNEQIRARLHSHGKMVAAGELFEELPKRENWYDILVTALREIGEDTLADELEGPEKQTSPSGSSQIVATGNTSHHVPVSQSQGRQQHPPPPASDPLLHASQERRPEAEASVTPGYPVAGAEGHKGDEKHVRSGPDENPGQQPPSGASLQMPVQERKNEPQSRESGSGGARASNASLDLQPQSRESGPGVARASNPSLNLQPQSQESGPGVARASNPSLNLQPQSQESGPGGARASNPSLNLQPQSQESGPGGARASNPSLNLQPQSQESGPGGAKVSSPSLDVQLQARESGPGGARARSPILGLEGHDDSGSDESNISPKSMERAKENAGRVLFGNASPSADAHTVGVSVHTREAAQGRIEENVEERRARGREVRRDDEEWNFKNEVNQVKNLHLQKTKDNTKINNLSPTKDSGKFNWNSDKTSCLKAHNVSSLSSSGGNQRADACAVREKSESKIIDGISKEAAASRSGSCRQQIDEGSGVFPLSSRGVNPREDARALSEMSESEILEGISEQPTAFQSGSRLQQIDKGTCHAASIGGGQGIGGGGSGTGEMGAAGGNDAVSIGGMQGTGERVGGSEEMGATGSNDASNDNQGSAVMKIGRIVRSYLPTMINSVGDRMLSP